MSYFILTICMITQADGQFNITQTNIGRYEQNEVQAQINTHKKADGYCGVQVQGVNKKTWMLDNENLTGDLFHNNGE